MALAPPCIALPILMVPPPGHDLWTQDPRSRSRPRSASPRSASTQADLELAAWRPPMTRCRFEARGAGRGGAGFGALSGWFGALGVRCWRRDVRCWDAWNGRGIWNGPVLKKSEERGSRLTELTLGSRRELIITISAAWMDLPFLRTPETHQRRKQKGTRQL